MKADDLRAQLFNNRAHVPVEGEAERAAIARPGTKLFVIRLQQRAPGAVICVRRHLVAEEVKVERTRHPRSHFQHLAADLIGGEEGARQRSQRAALDRRNAEVDSAGPGHRRLDDWELGPDQVKEPTVGPAYHVPAFGIDAQGSAVGNAAPFWSSSIEIASGARTNALRPSRGGRMIVTPLSISRWHDS